MCFLRSSENLKLQEIRDDQKTDPAVLEYLNFLLKVVEGKLKQTMNHFIELPPSVNIVELSAKLVESVLQIRKKI